MTNRIGMFALCVFLFVCGVFAGIWIGRSNWVSSKTGRHIEFMVQPYEKANLIVKPYDTIEWIRSDGQNDNLTINFPTNDSPCIRWTPGDPKCQIDPAKSQGVYFYDCGDKKKRTFDCPDPGIQPRGTTGTTVKSSQNTGLAPGVPATVLAAITCMNGTVEVTQKTPTTGMPNDPIAVVKGQTIYWDSPYDIQVSFQNGNSPCDSGSSTLPTSPQQGPLSCFVSADKSDFPYTVTTSGCSKQPTQAPSINVAHS